MHKTHLHTALTSCLIGFATFLSAAPRLTIVALVDGLRHENIQRLQPYFSQGGLRLLAENASQTEVIYSHEVYGGIETVATLLTGENPATHGIAMDTCFHADDRNIYPILEDKTQTPIGTAEYISPKAVLSPLLADHFRYRYGEQAQIYAIGQSAPTTVLMAGHAANGCCWLSERTSAWGTTSYYTAGLPTSADEYNLSNRISEILATDWKPRMETGLYTSPTDREKRKNGFVYPICDCLHQSPAINTLTVEMALALQNKQHLGEDDIPDLLCLQFTTQTPRTQSDIIQSAEQEDLYLALNQDLGFLIEQLIRRVGADHLDLWLIGIPRHGLSEERMAMVGMPVKQFFTDYAAALSSTYLMALYGHQQWVLGGYGNTIFLNHELIEQERLSLYTIQQQVADLLMDFEGVRLALPVNMAYLNPDFHPALNKQSAGDVVFSLQPMWQLAFSDGRITDFVIEMNPKSPVYHYTKHQNSANLPTSQNAQNVLQWILNQ